MAFKICLDAGHDGKYNQSGVVPAYYESDFNWKLYTKLKKYLEEYGITVIGTRANQNVEMGTISRGKKSVGCDLFISLHANAADRETADYVLVIEMLTKKKHDLATKFAATIKELMGTKEPYDVITKKKDSGGEWYGVLQGCEQVGNDSGFIIEHSFYTNKAMATWMMNDDNIGKLAEAEAKIIAEYFGINKPQPAAPSVTTVEFHANDIVSIKDGAVYTTGAKIPSWVRKKLWIIKSISGNVAIIDKAADGSNSINSPVDVKYLELVQPAKIEQPAPQPEPIPEPTPEPTPEPVPAPVETPVETPEPVEPAPEVIPEQSAPSEPEVEIETEVPVETPIEEDNIAPTAPTTPTTPTTPTVPTVDVEVKTPNEGLVVKIIKWIIDFIVSLFKK